MSQNPERLTKNERRAQARELARQAREAERKREKRNRLLLQGGVAAALVAIVAIVALVIANGVREAAPTAGPKNMQSGGVVFGENLEVKETPALAAGEKRIATKFNVNQRPVHVVTYVDYLCPACGSFEETYGPMLEQYTGSGDISLEVYPLNFLDPQSAGTKYSSRAGNLLACVASTQPEHAFKVHKELFADQPKEGAAGHSNEKLLEIAVKGGAKKNAELEKCVNDGKFVSFIDGNVTQAMQTEVLGLAKGSQLIDNIQTGELQDAKQPQTLRSTPTVIVNGKQWYQPRDGDLESYLLKTLQDIDADATEAG